MPDEEAYEDSGLGHGIFSYCWSVREPPSGPPFGAIAAEAIQPDNTRGPSLAIARGPLGCSLLTSGQQNPLVFMDDNILVCGERVTYSLEARSVDLPEQRELARTLGGIRDAFLRRIAAADSRPSDRG
jgi:hypothetical protein